MSNANQLPFLNLMEILFNFFVFLHTYIRNWSLQPFSQDSDLASHTIYVVCVNFIHEWRDLQLKVDPELQIFEKLFMAILFTLRVFARNMPRSRLRRNIYIFLILSTRLQRLLQKKK